MKKNIIDKSVAVLKRLCIPLLLLCLLPLASCKEDETETEIIIYSGESLNLESMEGAMAAINFMSTSDWSASITVDWLALSATHGTAGNNTIITSTLSENTEMQERTATVTLRSGSLERTVKVVQVSSDYVLPEKNEYSVEAQGGDLEIRFTTNVSQRELMVQYMPETMYMWCRHESVQSESAGTGSVVEYTLKLAIDENTGAERTGYIVFSKGYGLMGSLLSQVKITQSGIDVKESADFSADKQVTIFQKATKGSGIPIVLMGDGFLDTDIADGTYDKVMRKAFNNLFTEEPMASLKDYFDVYCVNAVSKNNLFGQGYETVFGCKFEGGGSTGISGDETAVQDYVRCVDGIDMDNTLAVVIINSNVYAGTTYFAYKNDDMEYVEFAIAYCPIIYDLENDSFRQVLCHEAVGHGFAKLEDEYYYMEYGTIGMAAKQQILEMQEQGWAQNVDFTTDKGKVLWSKFISDSNYDSEGIGIYEGACTYYKGVYRPTENSMMNDNTVGFNAPSRMAIYNRVMEDGMGEVKSYDEFVSFDKQTSLSTNIKRPVARSQSYGFMPFARPRMANSTLKYMR